MMGRKKTLMAVAALVAFTACESTTAPGGPLGDDAARVGVDFRVEGTASSSVTALPGSVTRNVLGGQPLALTGSNGTLTLDEIWLVVAEFELERANDDDCSNQGSSNGSSSDSCEKFQGPPQFVSLPLTGDAQPTVSQDVPADLYDELEFEVEDLELDEDEDNATQAELQALFNSIRQQFPGWPRDASMLVVGSFTPTGGSPVPFSTYFEAEIEIELEFQPPLNLTEGDAATATVVVDPALWFTQNNGTVMDLSQFQGQLVEFEVELEDGFTELEWEDD